MNNSPLYINGEMIKLITTYTPDGTMYWLSKEYEIFRGINILFSTIWNVSKITQSNNNITYNGWNYYMESLKIFKPRLDKYLSNVNLFVVQGSHNEFPRIDELDIGDYMIIRESANDLITAFDQFINELIKYYNFKTAAERRAFLIEGPVLHSIKSYASEIIDCINANNVYTFPTLSRFLKCIDRFDEETEILPY